MDYTINGYINFPNLFNDNYNPTDEEDNIQENIRYFLFEKSSKKNMKYKVSFIYEPEWEIYEIHFGCINKKRKYNNKYINNPKKPIYWELNYLNKL